MNYPIRPNVRRMAPYVPGKPIEEVKRELGLTEVVKLASNENPFGPGPKAIAAVTEAAARMHLYPDASGHDLKVKLAAIHGLTPAHVMLGNGSDELIHLLGLIFLSEGDNMVVGNPTFVRYDAAAHLSDIDLRKIPLGSDWRHDLPAMARAVDERTRLIFVANPHNPTGTTVSAQEFEAFRANLPETAVLVLDEAYIEYAEGDIPNSVDYVRQGARVVALRTFSKAYGLAGIRVGYGLADPEVVDAIDRAREPFDVNLLAQAAALAALDDTDHLAHSVRLNRAGLERIEAVARELGLSTVPSHANFVCIDLGRPAKPVFEALLARGIIIRPGEPLGMPTHIRVSVGTPEEIEAFVGAFRAIMAPAAV